ncbi:unnamed protein product [Alternaria alternata]
MASEIEADYSARPDGPDDNEIMLQTQRKLPLTLPWGHTPIRLGTTFHSSRQSTKNPWSDETPFVLSDLHMIPKELHFEYGTTSTFKKVSTRRERETKDHLTLGFGVGVGLPFLAAASVKGEFDQNIEENRDVSWGLNRQPRLNKEAIIEIKYGGGYEALCKKYGDYYLSGYRLGGDTGILISAAGHTRNQIDTYGITATVTVLMISASKHWDKDFRSFVAGRSTKLLGYDTIDGKTWKRSSAEGAEIKEMQAWGGYDPEVDNGSLRADADAILTRSENTLERILDILEKHGYRNSASLTFNQCEELVAEGVVVELLLQPLWRLRDVVQWRLEDNII